jgi:GNAT superfamily N-acetyltransferase
VCAIQKNAYPKVLHEAPESFAAKIEAAPETCWGVFMERGLGAYLIALPLMGTSTVGLGDTVFPNVVAADQADCLYLHDLAVDPSLRGKGCGEALTEHALQKAASHGMERLELVAVQGAQSFWVKFGFVVTPHGATASYGDDAVKMIRLLR